MKVNFTSAKMNVSITTNSGKPIYSYGAENVSIDLDVPALIEGAVAAFSMIEQAVNTGVDLSNIETLVASMQQQAKSEESAEA